MLVDFYVETDVYFSSVNIGNLVQGEHPKIRAGSLFSAENLQYL